jgi:hypothetical protein
MISSVSYAENIDPALVQSSSSASASASAMYPQINVSNTPEQQCCTSYCPSILHLYNCTSAVTSHCSETTIDTIEFPLPCINYSEPGIRATVVKRAKLLFKDCPRICRELGISNDNHAVMNDFVFDVASPSMFPTLRGQIQRTTSWRGR